MTADVVNGRPGTGVGCAAGVSSFYAMIRLCLPESRVFLKVKDRARMRGEKLGGKTGSTERTRIFWREMKKGGIFSVGR